MEKNIFAKNKKYNPDVIVSHDKKKDERTSSKFIHNDKFFNNIKKDSENFVESMSSRLNPQDSNYKIDKPLSDLDKAIEIKMKERQNQEFNFKEKKNIIPSSNPNEFHQFNDLKNNDERKKMDESKNKKKNEHDLMIENLKDLGILNK